MSYEPTNWKDGDLVTSAKLNKIEQGIAAGGGSGVPIIHAIVDEDNVVLDKTWQEIYDVGCGIIVIDSDYRESSIIMQIYYGNNEYKIYSIILSEGNTIVFKTSDPSSYPYMPLIDNSDPGNTTYS